jgi:hypothetical protein
MSPEEAVEIILLDEGLDVCANCHGVGYIRSEPDTPELLSFQCPVCRGTIASFERLRKNPLYKEQAGPYKLIDIKPTKTMTLHWGSRTPNVQNIPSRRYPKQP